MLLGNEIDYLLIGGSAYGSRKLDKGDVIMKVDGKVATKENVSSMLIGSDIPGSTVTLTVQKVGFRQGEQVIGSCEQQCPNLRNIRGRPFLTELSVARFLICFAWKVSVMYFCRAWLTLWM